MEFKRLEQNKKSKIIICFIFIVLLLITILLMVSKAKYQVTKNVQIVNGKVNYMPYDFKIVNIYKENDEGEYKETDEVPTEEGYIIDEIESKCMINDNQKDEKAILKTVNGNHTFGNLQKMDKCTLYFRKKTISDKTLEKLNLKSNGPIGNITGPSCDSDSNCGNEKNMSQNGVYEAEDDFGTSYVFRGTINNNWVKFGKMNSSQGSNANKDIWWRIIRINGNGTIRLIYAGTTNAGVLQAPDTTGTDTQITTTYTEPTYQQYNKTSNDNKYVGFMYGGQKDDGTSESYKDAHENINNSTIKDELDKWWDTTNLETLKDKLDVDTGFCNDRQINNGDDNWWSSDKKIGYGTSSNNSTAYAPWGRVYSNSSWKTEQTPTLKCGEDYYKHNTNVDAQQRDLFTGPDAKGTTTSTGTEVKGNNKLTHPVGLITSDEVVYAGGFGGNANSSYWLYTNSNYWTMSPCYFNGSYAYVFFVGSNGYLHNNIVSTAYGVRPVINLKADTKFTVPNPEQQKGISTNPYVVE